jgi:cysteine desulfurase/selenocysteine lyase
MERFNIPATTRASFAFYNTKSEVDALITAIHEVKEVLG